MKGRDIGIEVGIIIIMKVILMKVKDVVMDIGIEF